MLLNEQQQQMCADSKWDFSDLRAIFLNCTLKKSSELSHTQGLIDISSAIMKENGVSVDCLRPVDHQIATGVWPDMTEHGWEIDEWPQISRKSHGCRLFWLLVPQSGSGRKRRFLHRLSNGFMQRATC